MDCLRLDHRSAARLPGHLADRLLPSGPHRGWRTAHLEAAFETIEASGVPALAGSSRQQKAGADELELQSGRGGAGHLGQARVDDVGRTRQGTGSECRRLLPYPLELVLGGAAQDRGGTVRDRGNHDQVPQAFEQILDKASRVLTGLDDLVDLTEHGAGITGGQSVNRCVEQLTLGESQQ